MGRIHIRFPHPASEFGGVTRVNHRIAELLERSFETVDRPDRAELQVCAFDADIPAPPRRPTEVPSPSWPRGWA